jgi:hypothetical protein
MTLECCQQIFVKDSNNKFNANPSNRTRVVSCGQARMMKLIVFFFFCNFANAPKNRRYNCFCTALMIIWTAHNATWGPPSLVFNGYRNSFPGVKQPLSSASVMIGVKSQLPLFISMAWTGRNLTLCSVHTYCFIGFCYKTTIGLFRTVLKFRN